MTERRVRVEAVAWLAAIVPLIAGNLAYLISASDGVVPWCFPYLDGCTSISRAARGGIANPIFRGIMLPYAMILMLYWWLTSHWLKHVAPEWRARRAMLALGTIGALFLMLYTTFLGVEGDIYQWLRRYGITVHFSFTVLAQFLLTHALARDPQVPPRLRQAKVALCAAMLVLGIASIPLQYFAADRDAALNALEWSYSLLMVSFFALTGIAWRRTGYRLRLQLGS